MLAYPLDIRPDDQGYLVTCPDLPEVVTDGDTEADAIRNAVDAIMTVVDVRIMEGEAVPDPSPAAGRPIAVLPVLAALKVSLYCRMRDAGLTKAELARRLDTDERQIDQLLDLYHATPLDRIEAAAQALGGRVDAAIAFAAA